MKSAIPEVPSHIDMATRRCLTELRKAVIGLMGGEENRSSSAQVRIGFDQVERGRLIPDEKPTALGSTNAGKLFYAMDFDRTFRWNGHGWENGPGEDPQGEVRFFTGVQDPGVGWHLCDGATIARSKFDGSTVNVTLPDYSTAAYLKVGTASSVGPNAAAGATSSASAGTPAGTVSQPIFTGSALGTHQHETSFYQDNNLAWNITPWFGRGTNRSANKVLSGADFGPTDVAASLTELVSAGTPSGTVSQPTFTGSALATHSHTANTLELRNTVLKAYYRL